MTTAQQAGGVLVKGRSDPAEWLLSPGHPLRTGHPAVDDLYRLDSTGSGYVLTGPLICDGKAPPVPPCVGQPIY